MFFYFFLIIIIGFYFYIELPTKCKDLVSGIGFHLILAYFLYSLHVNSYFPAFKQVQQYIHRLAEAGAGQEQGAWKGHMRVHWAREQTPGQSRRVCDAGFAASAEVQAASHRHGAADTRRRAWTHYGQAPQPRPELRQDRASAAFWKSGCSSSHVRAGVCSGAGEKRKMKGGTNKSPGQGQVTAG